jgi:hypothetical protein
MLGMGGGSRALRDDGLDGPEPQRHASRGSAATQLGARDRAETSVQLLVALWYAACCVGRAMPMARSSLLFTILPVLSAACGGSTTNLSSTDGGNTISQSTDGQAEGSLRGDSGGNSGDDSGIDGAESGSVNSSTGGNIDSGSGEGDGDAGCPSSPPTGEESCSPGQPPCEYTLPGHCSFSCQCSTNTNPSGVSGTWVCGGC